MSTLPMYTKVGGTLVSVMISKPIKSLVNLIDGLVVVMTLKFKMILLQISLGKCLLEVPPSHTGTLVAKYN